MPENIDLFTEILSLAETSRPGYRSTLGSGFTEAEITDALLPLVNERADIPEILYAIYGEVAGTPHQIQDQQFMDLTPGYRLIHLRELAQEVSKLGDRFKELHNETGGFLFPVLANYSSDYICVLANKDNGEDEIYDVSHDDATQLMHVNSNIFLTFVRDCYRDGIYFLDDDKYLDYDADREWDHGRELNPDLDYWLEE